ncbi:MAG: hypothetical protein IJ588_06350 [Prevotella sp.]|nr:hypothetical protein [Prevotella sp.]
MKKMISLLVIAMMATATFAQSAAELAKQQKELNEIHMKMLKAKPTKDAKKQAKELKKEGWLVPAGELSIEQQITRSQLYGEELTTDENGGIIKRFIQQTGQTTSGTYNAGVAAARAAAQTELAAMLKTEIVAAFQQKLYNQQNNAITSTTIDKFNERARAIVDQSLTNSIPVLAIYRVLPNNNYQVQVRIAYDKKELAARIKRNMQRELEREGDSLDPVIEDVFCNKF